MADAEMVCNMPIRGNSTMAPINLLRQVSAFQGSRYIILIDEVLRLDEPDKGSGSRWVPRVAPTI